ncbi:MAG: YicC family protein [Gammaproteobacteria bacterium]|nr:YicC family protein [Gammaproteobacteria bacterium]MBU2676174.1 YicC family protein [Gammaproteobacteria bacterium]NNC58069.1 YicC family protein [Woeseiaceae bacterium]NNL49910.1 YicC family protein [Woeseiaceae bacterium]
MLHSMTGFARESVETDIGTLTWEIRAVNHRYLDVQFKLPEDLRPKEQSFRQQASSTLARGKIECSLYFRRAANQDTELQLDTGLVGLIGHRISELTSKLPNVAAANPIEILRWPGVILQTEIDTEPLFDHASELLAKTLGAINTMRASEGQRIGEMLESRCADIAAISASVRDRMPDVLEATRIKQKDRIEKLNIEADPARLELELALVAQKIDVDEELDRLESHLVEIRDAVGDDKPVGRRLDFLMQELNREANTLGSKSADTETTKAAVDLKVLIEQMREQIQNVE